MISCAQTKAIQSHIIMPTHLNGNKTLYGGQMMMWLDETAGISAARIARSPMATASIDSFNFLLPMLEKHSICIETFVSGTGSRSIEVFCKVTGEDLATGNRYLAATGFMTWVVRDKSQKLAKITPESAEEILICQDYEARRAQLALNRKTNAKLFEQLPQTLPWLD